ncbi:FKBP-type peptidyl-prolyl cis-trans isomerase [Streptomyces sp. 8L]|uniref:FKBP-type peptidyl-prolyl cis-trans isomerase n=1 Tax=Streptomyces sp. 8L TaxID=2877242 RepID=UPI001CD23E5A|nr:FKBP-type peptidyl-prolyl cis-trans isomerase [Streptomyces sp. 8L]MCA1217189.1 FKBP-type peptidyl-prolyl cis-trans isomerase [Streptomyces sp. 8L]
MRRSLAALLIVPALVLTAACGGGDNKKDDAASSAAPSPSASAPKAPPPVASADPMPTVSGASGKAADITVPKGKPSGKFVVHPLSQGSGPAIKKDQLVVANFTAKIWGGKSIGSSYDKGAAPQVIPAGSPQIIPAFSQAVQGQKVGSRVLVVAPPSAGFGSQGNQQLGVKGTDTLVFALDIQKILPKQVKGTQSSIPKDLPQIKADAAAPATIDVPKSDPPKSLVKKVLIQGKGATIKSGQSVVMQYTGVAWKANEGKSPGKAFDSSWNTGIPLSTTIGTGAVIKGWDQGIVGQKVGSRVMLVIPPSLGYGSQSPSADLPANSTLVFVVDILGAM